MPPTIKYCIFDMDGLLLDTESIYTEGTVTQGILQRFGHDFSWELKSKMMGMRQLEAANLLVDSLQLPITADQYLEERNRRQQELFPHCSLMPGVERLIRHLHANNIPMAVATSSHRQAFHLKTLSKHQCLFSLFQCIITADDIERGKPEPDIFLTAAKMLLNSSADSFNLENSGEFLVLEDAPAGVQAAVAARMPVCWVPDPRQDTKTILQDLKHPVTVLGSLNEFQPEKFGLPAFTDWE